MFRVTINLAYRASIGAAVGLASCSGTHSNLIPASGSGPNGFARASFVVHWPSAQREASLRSRSAISPSTASITIAVNGAAPQVVNKPTLTGSPTTTSVAINAPIGVDSFTFLAWDRAGGIGNVLDKATTSQSIVANADNIVSVSLDGVCAALVTTPTANPYLQVQTTTVPIADGATQMVMTSLRLDGPFAQTVAINQIDPDGNTIINSGGNVPIALNESGSTAHVTIAPASATAGNNSFTLTPLVAEPDGFSTMITASSPVCGSGTTSISNSFALNTSAIVYVADQSAGIIAYDQDGNELSKIATTTGITGLAYNPQTSSLIAVEPKSATTGGVSFQTLSLMGTSLGSGTLKVPAAVTNPVGNIAYNPANGYVLAGFREYTDSSNNVHYGTVLEYTIAGSTATAVAPTGTNPFQMSSSTPPPYDVDSFTIFPNGSVIVGDSGSDSYLFDKNGNFLNANVYEATTLAYDSSSGDVFDFISSSYGYAFNGQLTSTSFFNLPETFVASAAAYNQGPDLLYAFGGNMSFAVSGSSIYGTYGGGVDLLGFSAFPGLTSPTQAVILP